MRNPEKKRKTGGQAVHSDSLKILIAREYLEGKQSYLQLAQKYNLPSADTVRYFVKWYHKWERELDIEVPSEAPIVDHSGKSEQELKDELFEANLKITAFEMLISKMQDHYGEDFGKKPGAKSSKK